MISRWDLAWHMGLTHQFKCHTCGWPLIERPVGRMWAWHCSGCGHENGCTHAPRVQKRQHRVVVVIRIAAKRLIYG